MFLVFFLAMLLPQKNVAQNGFLWNSWVGCGVGNSDRKNYSELIESGLCHRVCQQSTVTYTITGAVTAQMTNTIWHVVGGTIISTPNNSQCVVKWGTTTTGAIGFTTTQVQSNTTITLPDLCVNLTVSPTAFFTIAPYDSTVRPPNTYYACTGQELFFENLSSTNGGTPITGYYWNFGDGTSSAGESVSHTYYEDGTYEVILKADNNCNCSSKLTYTVVVEKKGVQIDCPSVVCEGQKAIYSLPDGFAQNCSAFNWSVIGGEITTYPPYDRNIEVLWDENPETQGFGYVTFDPVGCSVDCYRASTLKIPIIKQKTTIVGETSLCGPTQVRYKLPQWPTTDFEWEILNANGATATLVATDQRNEVLLNPGATAGTVTLKCRYTNTLLNCGGNAIALIITIKQPALIDGAAITCIGTTEYYSESSGLPLTWVLKKLPNGAATTVTDVNFGYTFNSAGDYSLIATGPSICNPISKIITVTQNPIPLAVNFTSPLTVCPGSPVTYTFNNTVPNTRILWQVTGGQIVGSNYGNSVQIMFGLQPSSGANYTIKLFRENISTIACTSDPLTLTLSIPEPFIDIKGLTVLSPPITTPCGSSTTTYQVADTYMDNYEWELSNPSAGNISFPDPTQRWKIEVLWNQYSNLAVTLKLKTKKCLKSYEKTIGITIGSPVLTISPAAPALCRGDGQTFTLFSNGVPFTGAYTGNILWDFGNGDIIPSNTPTQNYAYNNLSTAQATYLVKATITNPNGCTSVVTTAPVTVTVKVAPVGIVTPSTTFAAASLLALTNTPVASRTLTVTLSAGYVAVNNIKWYKEANNVVSLVQQGLTATYIVTDFGNYYAELSSNTTNCSSKTNKVLFKLVAVNPVPDCPTSINPTLALTNSCGTVRATAGSVGNPTSVVWTSSAVNPTGAVSNTGATFIFPGAGSYTVTYTATYTNNGVVCKVIRNANIIVPYIADLKYAITCGTGANYNVKLYDNSNFYPNTPYDTTVYKVRNTNTTTFTSYTVAQAASGIPLLAGNSYVARIEINKTPSTTNPVCSKEVTFALPAKPNIAFAFANTTSSILTTCPKERINFTLTPATINPNWQYEWTFEPLVTNLQPNAYVTYAKTGSYNVSLKVTDQYGCTFTTPAKQVIVKNAQQLTVSTLIPNITQCLGTTATLSFTPDIGIALPVSYLWMKGNSPVNGGTTNPFSVTTPGSYWLQTANASGCLLPVLGFSVSVAFVDIPKPLIITLPLVCNNNGVHLSNNITSDPSLQYNWTRNGQYISSEVTFTDYPPIGTYTYNLEVFAPQSNGSYCSKISDPSTVTVIDAPQVTSITFEQVLNPLNGACNPFRIKLKATANAVGTFTWSNGAVGAEINETAGGAYQVLFTTASGCGATAQIYVPKDLTSYMWVVPKGCYTFCEKIKTQQIIGPAIQEFPGWAWLNNGAVGLAGTQAVTPVDFNGNIANYNLQLQLNNTSCDFKSDPFSITYQDCNNNMNCNWYNAVVSNITIQTIPYITYKITLNITNTTSSSFTANLTTNNSIGFFIPAVLNVPPGGGTYTVDLLPNDGILLAGAIDLLVTAPDRDGNLCQNLLTVAVPGSSTPNRKSHNMPEAASTLAVFPNPSATFVTIQYDSVTTKGIQLEVYDTTSRLIQQYAPTTSKGSWELPVQELAAGMYIVVLKQEGVVVAQKNLIKK